MVKKALVDIILESRILALDFTKNQPEQYTQQKSGKQNKSVNSDLLLDSENGNRDQQLTQEEIRHELIKTQKRHRDLFSEFLLLVSLIIKRQQTEESMKLLNEVFIQDEVWNESVKAFTISLFLADLISPVYQHQLSPEHQRVAEQLRGTNLINFEEKWFFDTCQHFDFDLQEDARQAVYSFHLQAVSVLKYLKAITSFFEMINAQFFPQTWKQHKKNPNEKKDPQPNQTPENEAKEVINA